MQPGVESPPDLHLVLEAGLASVALGLVLLGATVVVRLAVIRRERRDAALTEEWTAFFLGIGSQAPAPSMPRRRSDRRAVLALWNRIRAAVKGSATVDLEARGRAVGLNDIAAGFLRSRRREDRIGAVHAVGAMHEVAWADEIARLAQRGESIALRQEAARALVRLDPVNGVPAVVDAVRTQRDWHPALAASVLEEGDPDFVALALAREVTQAAHQGEVQFAARLLRVLTAVPSPVCLRHVRALLELTDEPDLQAACLYVLGHFSDKVDVVLVRRFVRSDVWYVRVHAAAALGGVGGPDEEPVLTAMLHDEEWWVRQRAAESLGRLALLDPDEMAIVFEDHHEVSRFAGNPYSPVAEVLR